MDEWIPVEWMRKADFEAMDVHVIRITKSNSPFYEGTRFTVRDGSLCLTKSGDWEYEPMPSSRDDAFYKRCRFKTFAEAVKTLRHLKRKPRTKEGCGKSFLYNYGQGEQLWVKC